MLTHWSYVFLAQNHRCLVLSIMSAQYGLAMHIYIYASHKWVSADFRFGSVSYEVPSHYLSQLTQIYVTIRCHHGVLSSNELQRPDSNSSTGAPSSNKPQMLAYITGYQASSGQQWLPPAGWHVLLYLLNATCNTGLNYLGLFCADSAWYLSQRETLGSFSTPWKQTLEIVFNSLAPRIYGRG